MKRLLTLLAVFTLSCAGASAGRKSVVASPLDKDILAQQAQAERAFKELDTELNGKTSAVQAPKPARKRENKKVQQFKVTKVVVKNPVLKACGYGKNFNEAKNNSLRTLSETILSNVKAQEVLKRSLKGRKIKREYQSETKVSTAVLVKGVLFEDLGRSPEGYKVCAVLTESGLKETIDFLKKALSVDYSKLNYQQLKNLKGAAFLLLSISEFAKDEKAQNFAINALNKLNMFLNYARLTVNVSPQDATIEIDGKTYRPGQTILLPPKREYVLKIYAKGYVPATKRVYLGSRQRESLYVVLPKKIEGKTVRVVTDVTSVKEIATEILKNSGFEIAADSPNKIVIDVYDSPQKIDEYTKHNLVVVVKYFESGRLVAQKRGKMKPFFTTAQTEQSVLPKKVEKLTSAVLKALLNQI